MLASWTSATALTATSGPTFAYFYATSSSATSTLQGGFLASIGGGNIGIGTSTPGALFSLAGQGAANQSLLFSGINMVYASSSTTTIPTGVNAFSIATSSSTAIPMLSFDTTNSRVGFGTTSPSATFSVAGASYFQESLGIGTTSPYALLSVEANTTATDLFAVGDTGTSSPLFVVKGSGRVGIGTTSPAALFSVAGDVFIGASAQAGTGGTLKVGGTNTSFRAQDTNVAFGRSGCIQNNAIIEVGYAGCLANNNANYDLTTASADPFGMRFGPMIRASANITDTHIFAIAGAVQDDGTARTFANVYQLHLTSMGKGTDTTVTTAYGLYVEPVTIGGTNVGAAINSDVQLDMPGAATTNGTCKATAGGVDLESIRDCSGAPSDIAEWYDTTSEVELGDIVVPSSNMMEYVAARLENFYDKEGKLITENAVVPGATTSISVLTRSSSSFQPNLLGIVATAPYQTFGEDVQKTASHPQRIALVGRVPVKVSTESGPIKIGDRITSSSLAGVGMKATKDGVTVGIALESFDGSSGTQCSSSTSSETKCGKILVFVNLGYSKLDDPLLKSNFNSDGSSTSIGTNAFSVDQQSGKVNVSFFGDLNLNGNSIINVSRILGMDGKWKIDENGNIVVNKINANEVVTGKLCVEDICVTKDKFKSVFGGSSENVLETSSISALEPVEEETATSTP